MFKMIFLCLSLVTTQVNASVFTSSDLDISNINATVGDVIYVPKVGATYHITNTNNIRDCDKTLINGYTAEIVPSNSKISVKWCDFSSDQLKFDSAASHARSLYGTASLYGAVIVPAGYYNLTYPTNEDAIWYVEAGAEFNYPSNFAGTNIDNLSYLSGVIVQEPYRGTIGEFKIGGSDWGWIEDYFRPSVVPNSTLSVISPSGRNALSVYSKTSDKANASEGTIGISSFVLNDKTDVKGVAYVSYLEGVAHEGAGVLLGEESNLTRFGTFERILPSGVYGNTNSIASNYWIGGPVGSITKDGQTKIKTSAGITFAGGSATDPITGKNLGFDAGIVFTSKSFESSTDNEIIRTFAGSNIIWHGGGYTPKIKLRGETFENHGRFVIDMFNASGQQRYCAFFFNGLSCTDNTLNLGQPYARWKTVYTTGGVSTTSDRTQKHDIRDLDKREVALAKGIRSLIKSYKMNGSEMKSFGVIAQDVIQLFNECGLDYKEYDVVGYSNDVYSVKYDQLLLLAVY